MVLITQSATVEVAHVRRQGFGLAIEARRQRRSEDAEALLGRVDLHLGSAGNTKNRSYMLLGGRCLHRDDLA